MPMTFYTLLVPCTFLLFMFAYGACVGSLVNVLVYRLPRGMGVVRPASKCPNCGTKLTFRENIPILGWLLLRGKCRFCKQPISVEYPLVETAVALLFATLYLLFFGLPEMGRGPWFDLLQPEWALNGLASSWPELVVIMLLFGALTAVTLIDARTAQIPLVLVWAPALLALVFHVGHAIVVQVRHGGPVAELGTLGWRLADGTRWMAAPGQIWSIPTAGIHHWWFVGMALGGTVGLGAALVLLEIGLVRRSFADYDEWEAKARAAAGGRRDQAEGEQALKCGEDSVLPEVTAPEVVASGTATDAEMWIQYPFARREMLKEMAFVAMPLALAIVGMWLAPWLVERVYGPYSRTDPFSMDRIPPVNVPLWLSVLSGVLGGYLIGGAVVWGVRIVGSLAFGKEALGLGDVHLVAAIGACVGWIDAILGFFAAAFVGLAWTLLGAVLRGRMGRTLPYGPYIAVATLLVVVGKPGIEWILERLSGVPINLP
ncbi:MAG: A24 family peptidase [Phycisphaerales bacterium]|nr:A24 family peptidase [Phycisphaerales bacterium]